MFPPREGGITDINDAVTLLPNGESPGEPAAPMSAEIQPETRAAAPAPPELPAAEASRLQIVDAPSAPLQPVSPAAWGTSPPARFNRARKRIAAALAVVFLIGVLGGVGAYLGNDYLAQKYSPQQAVINFFGAQRAGDVQAMMADANFVRGDGSFDEFFNKAAVAAMLAIPENRQIAAVRILSANEISSSTSNVSIETMWANNLYRNTFVVRRNMFDSHYVLYNSWKVDIAPTTIRFDLPNQPGTITMDGLPLPIKGDTVQAITGFHDLKMGETPFYNETTQLVDGTIPNPIVAFAGKLSAAAMLGVADAIKKAETNCDATKYFDCPNHTYYAPNNPGYIYYLTLPGHAEIDYTNYVFGYGSDITTGMQVYVFADTGLASASGKCTTTMTVDGGRVFHFSGTWTASVAYNGSAFTAELNPDCEAAAA